jgi:LPS sulfotransferase NodH
MTRKGVQRMDKGTITIVSGLPRSGTSLMMSMLQAGGMDLLVDGVRTPDEDNPKGYYEFERVKQIDEDQEWLQDAKGKAVKMIAELLRRLPPIHTYKVIFMRREIEEILASQRQMLIRRGEPTDKVRDEDMARMYRRHLGQVEAWIAEQPNVDTLYVSYNDLLSDPIPHVQRINEFLGGALNTDAMTGVIDRSLYRQRK